MSGEGLLSNAARPMLADPMTIGRIGDVIAMTLRRNANGHDFEDPSLELRADLRADDIDMVSIAVDVEEHFGLDLSDAVLERIRTIGDLHRFVAGGAL